MPSMRPTSTTRGNLELLDDERGVCNVVTTYTAEYVRQMAMASPGGVFGIAARVMRIVATLGVYAGGIWYDSLSGASDTPERVRMRAQQLRETLTALGPSFIKAGQVLANRPDIVREDYMNELCVLQDDVPPFPDEVAFEIITEQLGRPLKAVFSSISERPVAAASLGQVYKAVLRDTGEEVAIKVQRPGIEPIIYRDLFIFRALGLLFNAIARKRLGCNAELIVDEFGEKLLEELDYLQEARNIEEFGRNFAGDPAVKIPWVRKDLCGPRLVVMEWVDGTRCTDPASVRSTVDVEEFIRVGVVSGLRQLLEFGLFHGDPHPGNIFALPGGRIAYVDFGNVAQLSNYNKQVLVDAVVHAVNEDYEEMAGDFIKLGFLAPGTDIAPIVPALENIWRDSRGQSLADFNFRTVTSKFNELVYQYPIRIPERYSLVIRSLLTQEGICLTLKPEFHFLEVAYPYVARRLLADASLRDRLFQVLFKDGRLQWERLENLLMLAKEGSSASSAAARAAAATAAASASSSGGAGTTALATRSPAASAATALAQRRAASTSASSSGRRNGSVPPGAAARAPLDLTDTVMDALKVLLTDAKLRSQVILALTADDRLHVDEVAQLLRLVGGEVDAPRVLRSVVQDLPSLSRQVMLSWADRVLMS